MTEKVTIGNCELWHGDCREVLPMLPRCDLILTDPPYGLGERLHRPGASRTGGRQYWSKHYQDGAPDWDRETVDAEVAAAVAMADKAVIWGGQFYSLPQTRCLLTWNKIIRKWSGSEAEHAWTNMDKPNRVFDYSHGQLATEGKHYHPTQKPLPLMEWCLSFMPDAETICDPFMGSGTTGVACVNLGRSFTGIERERKYFDIACRRIEQAYAQGKLFDDVKPAIRIQGDILEDFK